MTKIDIFSGFLGAGKTTLIKKLISESLQGMKLVLIENEFGEIGIDGGFLKEAGVQITEMNSGCICCTLVGDFGQALKNVLNEYAPDRIIIEPSGVGKLSDVIKAVQKVSEENTDIVINSCVAVVDAVKCKMYLKNFGEFFINQIEYAETIILSRSQNLSEEKLQNSIELIRQHNDKAVIITTPWEEISGNSILEAMEHENTLLEEMIELETCPVCGGHHDHDHHDHDYHDHDHDHHDHDHDENCGCDCGENCDCDCGENCDCDCHDDEDCGCHEDETCNCHDHDHHDHDHDHHDHDHDHDHDHHDHDHDHHDHDHHDHDHHDHDHHGHHHADEVFASWGKETPQRYSVEDLKSRLTKLDDTDTYGMVLRAKGIVQSDKEGWIHFDYVPGESDIRTGAADYTGRLCVIGSELKKEKLEELFS